MTVKLLTEHHLECLSLTGGCRGSYESTHVKMPHCWKSHALAQNFISIILEMFGMHRVLQFGATGPYMETTGTTGQT